MTESEPSAASPSRRSTGVPGLDAVLCGGFIPASVYLAQGSPGAGKTILANQICFHRAAHGEQCLYLTLLAESHDRMMAHLKQLDFFDQGEVPRRVYYESAFGTLEEHGLNGILRMLTSERKAHRASVIVLDGLFVLEESASSEAEFRKFINDLSSFAQLTGCTILLLTNSARSPNRPEYTMVDGWLELGIEQHAYQSLRYLQVHKFRGSDFLSGRHMTRISSEGLRVFPRLESALGRSPLSGATRRILSSGIETLDPMLGGGLREGSATLLVGPSGIGKTSVGLEFIGESSVEEPGLVFGFYEHKDDLIDKADSLGIDLAGLIRDGAVEMIWHPATENGLDELGYALIDAVHRRGVKRLFVDGVNAMHQSAEHPQRIGRFFAGLTNVLRAEGITAMYTLETEVLIGGEITVKIAPLTAIAHNILLLRYVELISETRRSLSIVKVRSSPFDASIREFAISAGGVRIGERLPSADDLLTGHAHPRGGSG